MIKGILRVMALLGMGSAFAASAAFAQADVSTEIAQNGIAATRDRLRNAGGLSAAQQFALGGLEMLGAAEEALQIRWRFGVSDSLDWLPLMRLPVPDNPQPETFDPAAVSQVFRLAADRAIIAAHILAQIPESSDFKFEINTADLWFDINANKRRDPGENVMEILGMAAPEMFLDDGDAEAVTPPAGMIIRFDVADAYWLKAYANLLAGVSEVILAYDPTTAIRDVALSRAKLKELVLYDAGDTAEVAEIVDLVAIIVNALDQQPDSAALARAHEHLLNMLDDNRTFWRLAEAETDDDAEWIPNARQSSAMGVPFPPETGALWGAFLHDFESLLQGKLLAPYWQLAHGAGINVRRMFLEPAPIDVMNWAQGRDALRYAERGAVLSSTSWQAFHFLMSGEGIKYAIILN